MKKNNHIPLRQNQLGAVGYIPLLNLLVFFSRRKNRFIIVHSINGVLLSLYFFTSYFLIPTFGKYLALFFVAFLAGGFIHASKGERYPLPLIGPFVEWAAKVFDKPSKAT